MVALEEKLKEATEKPGFVGYPNPAANGQLVISAGIPRASRLAVDHIYVCAEKGTNIYTYKISPKGEVTPDPWPGVAQNTGAADGFNSAR
jgi:hypothetical protein